MGLFDGITRRRARKKHDRAMVVFNGDLADWEDADERIDTMIAIVRDCVNGRVADHFVDRNDYGFMLENDEFPVAFITGTGLMTIVRGPGRYEGGYGGVSFPIFGRVRGHVGGQRGTYVQGKESMTFTDSGETMITNVRVMFRGDIRTEEWKFSRMMGMEHSPDGVTTISMSSKSKPDAIGYGNDNGAAAEVQFRFEIAAALARDTLPRFLEQLEAEKAHHRDEKPVPPPSPSL
ncbi:MAG: hypothetical protein RJA47_338 [Actinomycetota bacterium]